MALAERPGEATGDTTGVDPRAAIRVTRVGSLEETLEQQQEEQLEELLGVATGMITGAATGGSHQ